MQILPITQNYYQQQINFKGYSAKEICAELCKGACCNHGSNANANFKIITDKLCASYRTIPDELKSTVLIKAPIVKWLVNSPNPELQTLNKLANTYIDAISRETNPKKIEQLQLELDKLNKKMAEMTGDSETFIAVTNPELKDAPFNVVAANETNICMYKDHNKTNLCTIYHGIKDETGKTIERPSPCIIVGGENMPCPWHHPEKYTELYYTTKAHLAANGYDGLPQKVIQNYIAQQYNLNQTFYEKIWLPYTKTLDKTI